jgi:hypothetical protein
MISSPRFTPLAATGPIAVLPLDVSVEEAIRFPPYLDEVFMYYGLIILIIGAMAYATSGPVSWKRRWGKWLFGIGALFAMIGFNPGWLISLLKYLIP